MKKLLLASIILFATSCKKETPEPPVNNPPVVSSDTANFIIVNGDGHNSDTVYFYGNNVAWYQPSANRTYLISTIPNFAVNVNPTCSTIGTYQINEPLMFNSVVSISGVNYIFPSATVNILRYGAVGQVVNATYSGVFKRQSDTTITITVSGNFNLIRGNDQ